MNSAPAEVIAVLWPSRNTGTQLRSFIWLELPAAAREESTQCLDSNNKNGIKLPLDSETH